MPAAGPRDDGARAPAAVGSVGAAASGGAAAATAGPLTVFGAGSVGCFVGARLQAAGAKVRLVGRPRMAAALQAHGLTATDFAAPTVALPPASLDCRETCPPDTALALLCVKSRDTVAAARALARALPAGTPVLSLQNGVDNADIAAAAAPSLHWLPGMVGFNVVEAAPGRFHRATDGALAARDDARLRPWLPLFGAAGLPLSLHREMAPVLWGKLLLNLNNPVNALSGLPLREQLLRRDLRRVLAGLQREALAVLGAAGIEPARLTAVPPRRLPALLSLPTPLFRLLATRLLRIDPQARSSMADDVARGRPTEVDALCGAVVRLARAHGLPAPLNEAMVTLLSQPSPPTLDGASLSRRLGLR